MATLQKTKELVGPKKIKLVALGKFTGRLEKNGLVREEDIYVFRDQNRSLLSRLACAGLKLVTRTEVETVESTVQIQETYPNLFKGLGKIPGEYRVKLRKDAVPYALTTPRRVPIPLLQTVKTELINMEKSGVIRKVEKPTDWCAGMVVAIKTHTTSTKPSNQEPSGIPDIPETDPEVPRKVRICVDLTKLNESVCREKHDLPSVDQTLGQLAGAKIFTKLDANSGFWQVTLSPDSEELTTFITPFGRYCFRRLPFGITSAPEYYQRKMQEILQDLDGVLCLMDDIIIFGATQSEHDERVDRVLKRLEKYRVTLNIGKCAFSKPSITYLGHVVSAEGPFWVTLEKLKACGASSILVLPIEKMLY